MDNTPVDAMQLKPCPFCGGEDLAVVKDPRDQWIPWFVVLCNAEMCHTLGPARREKSEAITAWNTRTTSLAAHDGLVDALRVIAVGECRMNGIRAELSADVLRKIARAALASIEAKQ